MIELMNDSSVQWIKRFLKIWNIPVATFQTFLYADKMYFFYADIIGILYSANIFKYRRHFLGLRWRRFARTTTHVNTKLSLISDCCKSNKLSLNPYISDVIFISSPKFDILPSIHIDGNVVEQVNSCKYLSVHIDDRPKCHPHVHHLERKLVQYCGIIWRLNWCSIVE